MLAVPRQRYIYVIDNTDVDEDRGIHRTWHMVFRGRDGGTGRGMNQEAAFCGARPTRETWHGYTHHLGWPHNNHLCPVCRARYERLLSAGAFAPEVWQDTFGCDLDGDESAEELAAEGIRRLGEVCTAAKALLTWARRARG